LWVQPSPLGHRGLCSYLANELAAHTAAGAGHERTGERQSGRGSFLRRLRLEAHLRHGYRQLGEDHLVTLFLHGLDADRSAASV